MNEKKLIKTIVYNFYEKATSDFLIGYHFRKIQEYESQNFMQPPMDAFKNHLPRIERFWEFQLIEQKLNKGESPFNLKEAHDYLNIRKGEVGRWVQLFNETLDENVNEENESFILKWKERVSFFERIFLKSNFVLKKNQ